LPFSGKGDAIAELFCFVLEVLKTKLSGLPVKKRSVSAVHASTGGFALAGHQHE
jgi:hypothetical protein